jgi:hypothetical protein
MTTDCRPRVSLPSLLLTLPAGTLLTNGGQLPCSAAPLMGGALLSQQGGTQQQESAQRLLGCSQTCQASNFRPQSGNRPDTQIQNSCDDPALVLATASIIHSEERTP